MRPRTGGGKLVELVDDAGAVDATTLVLVAGSVVVVSTGSIGATFATGPAQAPRRRIRTIEERVRLIGEAATLAESTTYETDAHRMFGPLNGARVALVLTAVVAAVAALALGYTSAAMVLLAGVAVHGLGWLYLYRRRELD